MEKDTSDDKEVTTIEEDTASNEEATHCEEDAADDKEDVEKNVEISVYKLLDA